MVGIKAAVIGLVLVATLAALPAEAQQPEAQPVFTATPRTGLVDDQAITVSGSGLPRNSFVEVLQCRPGRPFYAKCDEATFSYAFVDGNGAFTLTFHVSARIRPGGGGLFDCRPAAGRCDLRILYGDEESEAEVSKALTFVPGAALAPHPTLTASPNTDLVDNQLVTLQGSGFHANSEYYVFPCLLGARNPEACDFSGVEVETDATGAIDQKVSVWAIIHTFSVDTDCRRNECELVAVGENDYEFNRVGRAPVAFAPDGPLAPPPEVTVTPSDDLHGRQTVEVSGSGFRANTTAYVFQCKNGPNDPYQCFVPGLDTDAGPTQIPIADDGTFTTELVVRRRIPLVTGGVRDCGVRKCSISVFQYGLEPVSRAITFVPLPS